MLFNVWQKMKKGDTDTQVEMRAREKQRHFTQLGIVRIAPQRQWEDSISKVSFTM